MFPLCYSLATRGLVLRHLHQGPNGLDLTPVRRRRTSRLVAAAVVCSILSPVAAHAQYLDPGAGSIIVQALVAAVVGAAAVVKFYGRRIAGLFSRRDGRSDSQ